MKKEIYCTAMALLASACFGALEVQTIGGDDINGFTRVVTGVTYSLDTEAVERIVKEWDETNATPRIDKKLAGKQDALPYPTNAIPLEAINGEITKLWSEDKEKFIDGDGHVHEVSILNDQWSISTASGSPIFPSGIDGTIEDPVYDSGRWIVVATHNENPEFGGSMAVCHWKCEGDIGDTDLVLKVDGTAGDWRGTTEELHAHLGKVVTNVVDKLVYESAASKVKSVNGQIGAVALTAADVGALPLVEDKKGAKTAVTIGRRKSSSAVGPGSFANGIRVAASGYDSHAEGADTTAAGSNSHAEGSYTTASEDSSHAEGVNTTASGEGSHAEGIDSIAAGVGSHASGYLSKTRGDDHNAFAWNGDDTRTEPYESHGEGTFNINPVGGAGGFWIGEQTLSKVIANGVANKADKASTLAGYGISDAATENDLLTHVNDRDNPHYVTVEQVGAVPLVEDSTGAKTAVTIGERTGDVGTSSLANGNNVVAYGNCSHAEGLSTTAHGDYSHAEGWDTTASISYAHAEGTGTTASGEASHAEGSGTTALGYGSHAEGLGTHAYGDHSHVEGVKADTYFGHHFAFAWSGDGNRPAPYTSHGEGTFNVNPKGGLDGFYIGSTKLSEVISNVVAKHVSELKSLADTANAILGANRNANGQYHFVYSIGDITDLKLPAGFGNKITNGDYMFYECSGLKSLSLPEGFGADLTRAYGMFYKCFSLTELVLPSGFGANITTDAREMFFECRSLKSLIIPSRFGGKISNAKGMFKNCKALKSLSLPEGFGSEILDANSMFYNLVNLEEELILPSGFGGKITDASYMFTSYNQYYLTLPDGFGQNATNLANCFAYCSNLTTLMLPDGFGQNSTNLENCFYRCSSLTTITGNPKFKVSLDLSTCTNLTHDSLMVVINGLQTVTATQTLTLGATNLAKLTDEEKAIATEKGWTLA